MMKQLIIAVLLYAGIAPANITEAAKYREHQAIEAIEQNAPIMMVVYTKL